MNFEMLKEFFWFLIPSHDFIQLIFFVVIYGLFAVAIIWVHRDTGPDKWQALWDSAEDKTDDGLNNSLTDLQNIVHTPGEKFADAMPGIVLVIGLLGTFLGLGVALNKASQILAGAGNGGMEHAMSDLMGMMEGLGTKFKTSTWGIIAFLLLRAHSIWSAYDSRRLKWCMTKIREHEISLHKGLLEERSQLNSFLEKIIDQNETQLIYGKNLEDHNKNIFSIIDRNTTQLESFTNSTKETIDKLSFSTDKMVSASDKNERSAEKLETIITNFDGNVMTTLQGVKEELNGTISKIGEDLKSSTDILSQSSTKLETIIVSFDANIMKTLDGLKGDLSQTISTIGQDLKSSTDNLNASTDQFSQKMSAILENMEDTLITAVKDMGTNFNDLTKKIGTEMHDGSVKIATSVDGMSENSKTMMTSFQDRAEQTQKTILGIINQFTAVSKELRNDIKSNVKTSEQMVERITTGMSTISTFQMKFEAALKDIKTIADGMRK